MNDKSLIYGLAILLAGGVFLDFLVTNRLQAQTQVSQQNPQDSEYNLPHPEGSPTATLYSMGMMSQKQAEQHFIQMMIPHHQGAVYMANLALSKAMHPEMKKLAEAIKTSQSREIEQMKAWYKQWYGTEVPASSGMGMTSMHSGTAMNQGRQSEMSTSPCMNMMGMNMMGTNLEALKNAPDFDKAFIKQMIPHHKMAIMMAGMVLDSEHSELRNLAKNILQTQSTEIEQMQQWNQTWFRLTGV